ncbi:MAG: hypothetical protein ABEN55_05465 [Bradymonadaceae bacterium]
MQQFSSWYPLTDEGVDEHAPDGPAALQIKRADGLVDYPGGKSAMVCYFYAGDRAADALRERFGDEIDSPGTRGHGELLFRYLEGQEDAKETLGDVLFKFVKNFGEPPLFNRHPEEE